MLAQPPLPVVHRVGEFGRVPVGVRIAGLRDLAGPRPGGQGGHPVGVLADPPVQHLGDRFGVGERPGRDGAAERGRAVQPGGLGFAQGAPQPGGGRVRQHLPGLLLGQGGADSGLVPVLGRVAGDVLPLHAEHVEPVGVGPFRGPRVGGGHLLPVPVQALRPGSAPPSPALVGLLAVPFRAASSPARSRSRRSCRASSGAGRGPGRGSAIRHPAITYASLFSRPRVSATYAACRSSSPVNTAIAGIDRAPLRRHGT